MVILEILIILKIPPWDFHVAVVKNINNVVVNKLANPHKIRKNASFTINDYIRSV